MADELVDTIIEESLKGVDGRSRERDDSRISTSLSSVSTTKIGDEIVGTIIGKTLREADARSMERNKRAFTPLSGVLNFSNSFGYDCKKLFNLCLIDDNTLVFASGNIIHFLDIPSMRTKTRQSNNGKGIGHITKNPNPNYNYLTVAENGSTTPIFIYKYPEMEIISTCKDGSEQSYTFINYSLDGELMVSQGGHPDNNLTVWNWKEAVVILRCKNDFENIALNVAFCDYDRDRLVSAGVGHIKFWTVSKTFTGLKLKCARGRFEKRDISDIQAFYLMENRKVLSSCVWGNILVWQEGLIKYEVCRQKKTSCHNGPITQISFRNNCIYTIGGDGFVRIWDWESIDLGNVIDEEGNVFMEVEPLFEYRIGPKDHKCELLSTIPASRNANLWYAQDGNGGIWSYQVDPEKKKGTYKMLARFSAGGIVGLSASPVGNHVASLGVDGSLHIHNYVTAELLLHHRFPAEGRDLIWIPKEINSTGVSIVLGFKDGVIRVIAVDLTKTKKYSTRLSLTQVIKGNSSDITKLSINPAGTILVSGSKDETVFIYRFTQKNPVVKFSPIGFIKTSAEVTAINWKPGETSKILVGCKYGHFLEANLPEEDIAVDDTYFLENVEIKQNKFRSIKSQVRRDLQVAENERIKKEKYENKVRALEELRNENIGIDIDEEKFLEESDDEESEELPLHIPEIPNDILWLEYTKNNSVCLSMGGYDAGFFYEYDFEREGPLQFTIIKDAEDQQIHTFLYVNDEFVVFGLDNGQIRVYQLKNGGLDLSTYFSINMHDNSNGIISALATSYDSKYIFSGGMDGSVFMYKWNQSLSKYDEPKKGPLGPLPSPTPDIVDPQHLSLEQDKQEVNERNRQIQIEEIMDGKLEQVGQLKIEFSRLKQLNKKLPEAQRLTKGDLELDKRITKQLKSEIEFDDRLFKRKMEFTVEKSKLQLEKLRHFIIENIEDGLVTVSGVRTESAAKTFPLHKIPEEYLGVLHDLEENLRKKPETRLNSLVHVGYAGSIQDDNENSESDNFLNTFLMKCQNLEIGHHMSKLLKSYCNRKLLESQSKKNREFMQSLKPDDQPCKIKVEDLGDVRDIVGALPLKTDLEKFRPEDDSDNTLSKLQEFNLIKSEMYSLRKDFNQAVLDAKKEKRVLAHVVKELVSELENINKTLPRDEIRELDDLPYLLKRLESQNTFEDKFQDLIYGQNDHEESCSSHQAATQNDELNLKELLDHVLSIDPFAKEAGNAWNLEMANILITQKRCRRDQILNSVNDQITQFDNKIARLQNEWLQIKHKTKYLECHLLSLHQELWIIKDCQHLEENALNDIDEIIEEKNNISIEIMDQKNHIDAKAVSIGHLTGEINQIDEIFQKECMQDQRFSAFLRKIYRKKEKDVESGEEDEYSSLSSGELSTDGEDFLNVSFRSSDSNSNVLLIEGKCPVGCNPNSFELAYSLRAQRMILERNLARERQDLQKSKFSIEELNTKNKKLELKLEHQNKQLKELAVFRRKTLNEIDTILILKMDQIKHFSDLNQLFDISNTVLLSEGDIDKLSKRADELKIEIIEEKKKRRAQYTYSASLKREFNEMMDTIAELKETTNKLMMNKFGTILNMDEMEESVLETFLFGIRLDKNNIKTEFERQKAVILEQIAEKEIRLLQIKKTGTEKLNILTLLTAEQNHQKYSKKLVPHNTQIGPSEWESDVKALKKIDLFQNLKLQCMKKEIEQLQRTKDSDATYKQLHFKEGAQQGSAIKIVRKFVLKHSPRNARKLDLEEHISTITSYLMQTITDYEKDRNPEAFIAIIQNLEIYLPRCLFNYVERQLLVELFYEVWDNFKTKENDQTIEELVANIISDKLRRVPRDAINFSDAFLSEVLQEILVFCELEDFHQTELLMVVSEMLKKVEHFYAMRVNVATVAQFMRTYLPHLNEDLLRKTIKDLVSMVVEKYKINDNIAKIIDEHATWK